MTLINDSCRRWPSSKWGTLMARQHRQGIYTAQSIINEWTSATERINYPSARCVSTRQTNLCFTDTAFHSLLFHWLAKSSACNMLGGWVEILAAWTVADNENVRVRWQAIGFTRRSSSIKGGLRRIEFHRAADVSSWNQVVLIDQVKNWSQKMRRCKMRSQNGRHGNGWLVRLKRSDSGHEMPRFSSKSLTFDDPGGSPSCG